MIEFVSLPGDMMDFERALSAPGIEFVTDQPTCIKRFRISCVLSKLYLLCKYLELENRNSD